VKYYCPICGPVAGTCDGMDGSMMQNCPAQPDEDEAFEEQRQNEVDKEYNHGSTKEESKEESSTKGKA